MIRPRVAAAIISIAALMVAPGTLAQASGSISPRLAAALLTAERSQPLLCIVYLRDKASVASHGIPQNIVTPRALQRRALNLPPGQLVDEDDLPLSPEYVGLVTAHVSSVRHLLRWFNAVSAWATPAQIAALEELDCVREIDLVGRFKRSPEIPSPVPPVKALPKTGLIDSIDYGLSAGPLQMLNVPAVHATGNHAEGILIGMFDNGVRLLTHHALDSLRPRIVGMRDFVDHKDTVVPVNPSASFGTHGLLTLSAIGGNLPHTLVGPAFGASFLLARTENDSSETPIEEDNWAAGIQWAESLGVQVTSTSLGYLTYSAPYTSWTWEDMDGNTTLITRAAAMAVRKGVIVVNSAGNNGDNPAHNTLNAPADADSIIAVGAVGSSGARSGFSSVGPTTSVPPVIKPDLMAQGESIPSASPVADTATTFASGTSLSCPLLAGVVALVLKAHPTETPMEIVQRLKSTASNALAPNNQYGWGIPDALAAINTTLNPTGIASAPPATLRVTITPNPFWSESRIAYTLIEPSRIEATIFDLLGREVRAYSAANAPTTSGSLLWNGTDKSGRHVSTGMYFVRIRIIGQSGITKTQTQKILVAH